MFPAGSADIFCKCGWDRRRRAWQEWTWVGLRLGRVCHPGMVADKEVRWDLNIITLICFFFQLHIWGKGKEDGEGRMHTAWRLQSIFFLYKVFFCCKVFFFFKVSERTSLLAWAHPHQTYRWGLSCTWERIVEEERLAPCAWFWSQNQEDWSAGLDFFCLLLSMYWF